MGIRLVVVDDNPHRTWDGRTYPVNATFHRFLAALLDLPGTPVASIVHAVPLRSADGPPATLPLDARLEVVGTAPFDGIEGYLRHLPAMLRANRPTLRRAIADADLLWLKVPASNAVIAAALAVEARVPRMTWVAGSAAAVGRARTHGVAGLAAWGVGAAYDAIGWAVGIGGDRVVVGADMVRAGGEPGAGLVTSLVRDGQVVDPRARSYPHDGGALRLVWAGRVVEGKGLEWLLDELADPALTTGVRVVTLDVIGDGPARAALEARAGRLGLAGRVRWRGYVAPRAPYLEILRGADAFVFPSEAEGFPKVVLDAWASAVPVLARPAVRALRPGAGTAFAPLGSRLAPVIEALDRTAGWAVLARGGSRLASAHTLDAEVDRLVARWRARWPDLPWPPGDVP